MINRSIEQYIADSSMDGWKKGWIDGWMIDIHILPALVILMGLWFCSLHLVLKGALDIQTEVAALILNQLELRRQTSAIGRIELTEAQMDQCLRCLKQ